MFYPNLHVEDKQTASRNDFHLWTLDLATRKWERTLVMGHKLTKRMFGKAARSGETDIEYSAVNIVKMLLDTC